MRSALLAALLCGLLALVPTTSTAKEGSKFHPGVTSPLGVVATESPAAAQVGRSVLEHGGNAVDAAVSTVFALGVARPQSCGIGGGGFMVYRPHDGAVATLDFRETAPAAIKSDTFTGPGLYATFTGHTTVGVPGVVAGMAAALKRYGTLSLRRAIAPAEELASRGFTVLPSLSDSIAANASRIKLFPATAAQYLHADGTPYAAGETLRQPDMARSLKRIMTSGTKAFYNGKIAQQIVADMRAPKLEGEQGLMTRADLRAYRAKWRTPLVGSYRGREIDAMPAPTSGGTAIVEMLNILEGFDLAGAGMSSAQADHDIAEAQRIAWADRNAYLADPDFVKIPPQLTDKGYAAQRRAEIDPSQTHAYAPGSFPAGNGADANPNGSTTQLEVIDRRGNAVSLTCTIEQEFGSAVVASHTGFLLNNELTDFSAAGTANEPAPGKRPRSSMSPTIVAQAGVPVLATGGAGGSRIVMGALETILDTVDFGQDLPHAVDAERLDDQGSATLEIEDARVDPAVLSALEAMGYTLVRQGEYAIRPRVQLAGIDPLTRLRTAVSDSRSDQGSLAQRVP
ncbi:MAG: gamma-glutamyltranspeptidase / glutathione hydrolase [Solirubrobacteraceae bacterium]|nr:gamma-glutamyltranspeptidase / glutathione hydrolase [Solirubrobacteraceae bacterium]